MIAQAEAIFDDKPIPGYIHESLRMYLVCKGMKWAHLPVPGGIYQQDPKFLDDMTLIMSIEGQVMQRQHQRRQREAEAKKGGRGRLGRKR